MVDMPKMQRPEFRGGPVVFLNEVRSELLKVTWPSRDQVIKLTIVVVIVSFVLGLYIGGLDLLLTKATDLLLKR